MQDTQLQSLIWEDPTCCRPTKPRVSRPLSLCSRARGLKVLKPTVYPELKVLKPTVTLEPVLSNK